MTRCYLKRSAKTAGALMVAFVMAIGLIDTRSRYSDYMFNIEPSQPYNTNELGVKKGEIIRNNIRLHTYDLTNKTEDVITLNRNHHEYHSTVEKNYISSNEASISGGGELPTDNESLTLRFWDLVNSSTRGAFTKGIFTETKQLPNLWRLEKDNLSRDDDRVLAQLIWAMEAANMSSNNVIGNKVKRTLLFCICKFS